MQEVKRLPLIPLRPASLPEQLYRCAALDKGGVLSIKHLEQLGFTIYSVHRQFY